MDRVISKLIKVQIVEKTSYTDFLGYWLNHTLHINPLVILFIPFKTPGDWKVVRSTRFKKIRQATLTRAENRKNTELK